MLILVYKIKEKTHQLLPTCRVLQGNIQTQQRENHHILELVNEALAGRAQTIFNQISPFLPDDLQARILDFGAGDGQVTQLIRNSGRNVMGVDPVRYVREGVDDDLVHHFDGDKTDYDTASFAEIVVTNVFHHVQNNQRCLDECYRLLAPGGTMVVIETVPKSDAREDHLLNYFNDWFYNRPFHPNMGVPLPGTYETIEG